MPEYAAELLVKTLALAGVTRVYGITGDSANHITDAIARSSIRFVHTRHEEVAAFAAGAEAAATGRLGVCMGSCGPGSLHLVNGLYDAHRNGSPVLALVTDIHTSQIGTGFIQEIDTRAIFRGCSCFCEYAQSAQQLPRIMGIAMQTALAKKGVAVVIVSGDVTSAEIDSDTEVCYLPQVTHPVIKPSPQEMQRLADQLNGAGRVTIYGGAGCIGASDEVMALARKLHAPVAWTYRGKEALDFENPYPVGMYGMLGNSAAGYAINQCDLLLLLGCGFAFTSEYPDRVRIVQVDLHGENLGRRHNVADGFVGDIAPTLSDLLPLIHPRTNNDFAESCSKRYAKAQQHLLALSCQSPDSERRIYPENLTHALDERIDPHAWVTSDMGTAWAFMGRYIESKGGRRFYTSSLHGTMAGALPSAIGLKLAEPDRQVVALCGDGGLSMLLGDLITLVQEKVGVKIVVYNNARLDFVSMEMKADGLRDSYTDLENPNFARVAEAIGIKGIRVERAAELSAALDEAFACEGAVLVDVLVDPNSMIMPPTLTPSMVGKFSHYIGRAVQHGDTEELLEFALTNLRLGK